MYGVFVSPKLSHPPGKIFRMAGQQAHTCYPYHSHGKATWKRQRKAKEKEIRLQTYEVESKPDCVSSHFCLGRSLVLSRQSIC